MSSISERTYAAAWIKDLEYILWEQIVGNHSRSSLIALAEDEIAELLHLSNDCGGWIVFDDKTEETYVPLGEWKGRAEGTA